MVGSSGIFHPHDGGRNVVDGQRLGIGSPASSPRTSLAEWRHGIGGVEPTIRWPGNDQPVMLLLLTTVTLSTVTVPGSAIK
jgi:hypothetical protein